MTVVDKKTFITFINNTPNMHMVSTTDSNNIVTNAYYDINNNVIAAILTSPSGEDVYEIS